MKMKIVLDENAIMPERANPNDAGLDLISPVDVNLLAGCREVIDTGVHVEIPQGYVGLITSKSGLMAQNGILTSGTIDSGYTGSLRVVLFNLDDNDKILQIKRGRKIAQLVIFPIISPELEVVDKLDDTARGAGGFGSTGAFASKMEKPHIPWEAN